ncbi:MAG: CDP-6-deoxy-delta-3,4-glucoseen reductase [Gammaproteobacteria bacterium]|nr:CDP-6-deoxy-delta-3,4-glucoseen reductase [Gammaproteobacteria bacterium]
MARLGALAVTNVTIAVDSEETILEAATRQQISIPVGCENGICGTCKGRVVSGEITYGDREIYGLLPEEQAEGDALFCCAKACSDLVIEHEFIEVPDAFYEEECPLKVEPITAYVYKLILTPQKPWRFKAGQYLDVHYQNAVIPLSIANAPGEDTLELNLQILENTPNRDLLKGLLSAKTLTVKGPKGKAVLRDKSSRPIIFLAGGSGFAPLKSMIEHLIKTSSKRELFLYWGARHPEFLYRDAEVQAWVKQYANFHYIPVISENVPEWTGRTGLVHEAVLQDFPNLSSFECYMAGPEAMVKSAVTDFEKQGMAKIFMHSDTLNLSH